MIMIVLILFNLSVLLLMILDNKFFIQLNKFNIALLLFQFLYLAIV